MAFVPKNFVKFNGYTSDASAEVNLFKYNAMTDTEAAVEAPGYFNAVAEQLSVNDILYLIMEDGTATGLYLVQSIVAGVVSIVGFATIGAGGVGTTQIADLAVTTPKLADAAVTALKLAADAVLTANIVDLNVTTDKLAANAVTALKLAADAVETVNLLDGAVTTAKVSPLLMQYARVEIPAADVQTMFATPELLVAAPAAGSYHVAHKVAIDVDFGGVQFATGGPVLVQYDDTAEGLGAPASAELAAATLNGYVADAVVGLEGSLASAPAADVVGKGLFLSNKTGAFTNGDSDLVVHVWYSTVVSGL
jgi:hypothetical protein